MRIKPRYLPRQGDCISVSFDPQAGREQKGRRLALVDSKRLFSKHTGLLIACPITNTGRDSPFHVSAGEDAPVTGFIMVEQIRSLDFKGRKAKRIGRATSDTLDEVLAILDACIY